MPPINEKPATGGTVTLSQAQFDAIMEKFSKLDKALYGSPVAQAEKAAFRTVKVSFVEDEPVIGFVNRGTKSIPRYVYPGRVDPDHPKEMIEYIDIIVRNPKDLPKPHIFALPYMQFLRECRKVICKIMKTNIEPEVISDGFTTGRVYKENTFIMEERGTVPVTVKIDHRVYEVALPDGTTTLIDEKYVNMP